MSFQCVCFWFFEFRHFRNSDFSNRFAFFPRRNHRRTRAIESEGVGDEEIILANAPDAMRELLKLSRMLDTIESNQRSRGQQSHDEHLRSKREAINHISTVIQVSCQTRDARQR